MAKLFMAGKPVNNNNQQHRRQRHNTPVPSSNTTTTNKNNNSNQNTSNVKSPQNSASASSASTSSTKNKSNQNTNNNNNNDKLEIQTSATTVVTDAQLSSAIATLQAIHDAGEDVFHHTRFKPLRSVVFSLVSESNSNPVGGRIARVSEALASKKFGDAMDTLSRMRNLGEIPKLGSVSRWVRDIDAASFNKDLTPFIILDMVMRVAAPNQIRMVPTPPQLLQQAKDNHSPLINHKRIFFGRGKYCSRESSIPFLGLNTKLENRKVRLAVYNGPDDEDGKLMKHEEDPPMIPDLGDEALSRWKGFLKPIYFEKAATRRPENRYDLTIWTNDFDLDKKLYYERIQREEENENESENNNHDSNNKQQQKQQKCENFIPSPTLLLDPSVTAINRVERIEIPEFPSSGLVCCLKNVFSPEESHSIIQLAEAANFAPDSPKTNTTSVLADNVVWMPDNERFMKTLIKRVQPHLPAELCGGKFTGINRRFRCYRYSEEVHVYRTHIDGGWSPSTIDYETEEVVHDSSNGTEYSQLTFLVYLNSGMRGGHTSFFNPAYETGYMDNMTVAPSTGCVMIFPHSMSGCIAHEGSGVSCGVKYIIRTEVMYTKK